MNPNQVINCSLYHGLWSFKVIYIIFTNQTDPNRIIHCSVILYSILEMASFNPREWCLKKKTAKSDAAHTTASSHWGFTTATCKAAPGPNQRHIPVKACAASFTAPRSDFYQNPVKGESTGRQSIGWTIPPRQHLNGFVVQGLY